MSVQKQHNTKPGFSSTSLILIGLNQSMQQSIQILSGSQGVNFDMVKNLFYGGPIALFFNRLTPTNNELILIMRYYNQILKQLHILEEKIENIDFDKIQLQSNSENRSKRIVEIAGEVDSINQSIIEQSSMLNNAFSKFHDSVVSNIDMNKVFLDDYLAAVKLCYDNILKKLDLQFQTESLEVFDIIRIPEIEAFAEQNKIDLAPIQSDISKLNLIKKFAFIQLYTQIEYNKILAKSVFFDSDKDKVSFAQSLKLMLKKSDTSIIKEQIKIHIGEVLKKNTDFLAAETPGNRGLLNELIKSDKSLKKLKLQLKKYPQRLGAAQNDTFNIPKPKSPVNWTQKGELPDNLD